MNNLKHIFIYSVILFSMLLFASCEREAETIIIEEVKCTVESPWGECEKEDDICYLGVCVSKDLNCGEFFAPCEDKYDVCTEDLENGGYKCVEGRCSYNNTDGYCKNENQICTSAGTCKYKCSEDYKDGVCTQGNSCLEGVCVDSSLLCSATQNNDGLCEEGKICALDSSTQIYTCLDKCGERFPDGACTVNKSCHFEQCYHDAAICGPDNLIGACEEGKLCDNGECKRRCSDLVQNGICEFDDQVCFEGECNFRCSSIRPEGICEDIATRCLEGECRYKCSSTVQNGYCDEVNSICIDGYCKETCSPERTEGVCKDRTQVCDNGSCEDKCTPEHPFGLCAEAGKACLNGVCIEECSQQYPNGSCPQYFQCINESCQEIPCGELNLNGPCFNDGESCIDGICLGPCSAQQPNGWCEEENFLCYNNSCVDGTLQACSGIFKNGFCVLGDEACTDGVCLKKECSPEYPDGRCEDNRICVNGSCERYSCSDERPLYSTGTPNLNNGGISGACCQINEDCKDGFNSYGRFITNICIRDHHPEGPYCLGVQLTSNDNGETRNNPKLCAFTTCTGCQTDTDCMDPYADKGTEQDYFCAMVTYYDYLDALAGLLQIGPNENKDISVSYCQRTYLNCTRKHLGQGERCDESCNDSECDTGLHCIKGICTEQCKDDSYCVPPFTCIPVNYELPDTDKSLFINTCLASCDNDTVCESVDSSYSCSAFTYESEVGVDETPTPVISFCRDKDTGEAPLKAYCNIGEDCNSRVCNSDNLCSTICIADDNCGENAYCHYSGLKTGAITHLDREPDPIDLNYLGECRYLTPTEETVSSCTGQNDCSTNLVNGKEFQCLPKFDLLKGLPAGKSGDAAYGRCGILSQIPNKAYSQSGESCNNNTQLCESDLCICGNELCKDNRIGTCLNYCEKSSDCDGDQYCKRILLREDVTYSKAIYGGVCESRYDNVDIEECDVVNSTFDTMCPSNKTCIYNAVNSKPETNNPNKFGVEYICVNKRTDKLPLNSACQNDFDCNSQLCNPNTNKCSHACDNNSQCGDVNLVCNLSNVVVSDVNPDFIVYAGVCE